MYLVLYARCTSTNTLRQKINNYFVCAVNKPKSVIISLFGLVEVLFWFVNLSQLLFLLFVVNKTLKKLNHKCSLITKRYSVKFKKQYLKLVLSYVLVYAVCVCQIKCIYLLSTDICSSVFIIKCNVILLLSINIVFTKKRFWSALTFLTFKVFVHVITQTFYLYRLPTTYFICTLKDG